MNALASVRGQEAETFKALAPFVKKAGDRHAAVKAMQRIPVRYWPREEAKPLLDSLLAYVRKVPVKERTDPPVVDALQLADSLASLLPLSEAQVVRKELGELGVRVIRVGTVVEQMIYDKERLVVKAGKPVEIFFENTDLMPHNFVVTQPGSLAEIGEQAEADATKPGAAERGYVPHSKKILLASQLVQPRASQKLELHRSGQAGRLPVCLHLPRPLAAHVRCPLRCRRSRRVSGRPGRLPRQASAAHRGRVTQEQSAAQGVEAGGSGACRCQDGQRPLVQQRPTALPGGQLCCLSQVQQRRHRVGPDLTKLDPKQQKAGEILKDVLDPSFRINEKFQSWTIETTKGKVVTGMILKETPEQIEVIENPLAKAAPLVIKKKEIAEKKKSPISIMPKGLLDKLTREEILDLVAYVASKGDPKHKLFKGGHDHGHHHH